MPPSKPPPKRPPPRNRASKSRRAYDGDDEMSLADKVPKKVEVVLDAGGPEKMGSEVEADENPRGVLRFFKGLLKS